MDSVTRSCPSKVNLFLEVLGLRPDGFHEIVTVMAPIDFGDTLTVRRSARDRFRVRPRGAAPLRDNTVQTAVRALRKRTGFRGGLDIRLEKRVPPGSGLGAGSSDAAAALLAVNELLGLRADPETLHLSARETGSDVPFFLQPQAALCAGRGELIHPLPHRPLHLVLALPGIFVSTASVYRETSQSLTRKPEDVNKFLNLWASSDARMIGNALFNALERPAFRLFPNLERIGRKLGRSCRMSGSGSGLFRICESRREAQSVRNKWEKTGGVRSWAVSSPPEAGAWRSVKSASS